VSLFPTTFSDWLAENAGVKNPEKKKTPSINAVSKVAERKNEFLPGSMNIGISFALDGVTL